MKAADIVRQLQSRLPDLSDLFATQIDIVSISLSGTTATAITAAPHSLAVGDDVAISNVLTPVEISAFVQTADEVAFETATRHDLTKNDAEDIKQYVRITASGGFDEVYLVKSVENRQNFTVVRSGQPALSTSPYLQQYSFQGFNGLKQVTAVPSTTSFEFDASSDAGVYPEPNFTTGAFISTNMKISAAVDIDTIIASYTSQPVNSLWIFVVLGENSANKDKNTENDAVSTQGRQMDYRQKAIGNFSLYLFVPNKGEILTRSNGSFARDLSETLRQPILQSVLGFKPDYQVACGGQEVVMYNGDSYYSYNGAVYVHEYNFQYVYDITAGDTAIRSFHVAFRDIDLRVKNQFSDLTEYQALVDLDDEPLT